MSSDCRPIPRELSPDINVTITNYDEWADAVNRLIDQRDQYRTALKQIAGHDRGWASLTAADALAGGLPTSRADGAASPGQEQER